MISGALQERQADQGLGAGQVDTAAQARVFVVQRHFHRFHQPVLHT